MTTIEQPTEDRDIPHPDGPFPGLDTVAEIKAGYDGVMSGAMGSVPETDHDTRASEFAFDKPNRHAAQDMRRTGEVTFSGAGFANTAAEEVRARDKDLDIADRDDLEERLSLDQVAVDGVKEEVAMRAGLTRLEDEREQYDARRKTKATPRARAVAPPVPSAPPQETSEKRQLSAV